MLKTQQVDERCANDNQLSTETTCVKNQESQNQNPFTHRVLNIR